MQNCLFCVGFIALLWYVLIISRNFAVELPVGANGFI